MEQLFIYTLELSSKIGSLCEELSYYQRILTEKKQSASTVEKIAACAKEAKKQTYFLRILEHVSYLEDYKNDIARVIAALDTFLEKKTYTNEEVKRIQFYFSSIAVPFDEENESKAVAALSLQVQCVNHLEETMKIIEEILLSFYGLAPAKEDLESKLIKDVEKLFLLKLEDLSLEEKVLIEEFFTSIQAAFKAGVLEGWEKAYIKCTGKLNKLKEHAGMEPNSSFTISIESTEEDEDEEEGEEDHEEEE